MCRYNSTLYAQYGATGQAAIWASGTSGYGAGSGPYVLTMQTASVPRTPNNAMLCMSCLPTARCVISMTADPAICHVICSHRAVLTCHQVASAFPCLEGLPDCMLQRVIAGMCLHN